MVSSWDEGEGKSREKKGGGGWMRKEGGKVRMSTGEEWDDRKEGTVILLIHGLCGMGLIGSYRLVGFAVGDSVG